MYPHDQRIKVLFTDIDDTLTREGKIPAPSYTALWQLANAGIAIVPVTGRPAGWCEMIARTWPVSGVVGENGGFYFRLHGKEMKRHFSQDAATRTDNQRKLEKVRAEILATVPGSKIASDQFCRMMDLAVDYAEDVGPLPPLDVQRIVATFEKHGAIAKVSSIHVNGWFGKYDKLSMCKIFSERELGFSIDDNNSSAAFTGDSPNDEPMFEFFDNSFGVANVQKFVPTMKHLPKYVANSNDSEGFVEIADLLLARAKTKR
jgi:HAD superfamily hydrolase (TIGR01484 family)